MRITSPQNSVVRFVRSLDRPSARRDHCAYIAEGVRLVTEALESAQRPQVVMYTPDLLSRTDAGASLLTRLDTWAPRRFEVTERVLRAASQTENPAGVLAVLTLPEPGPLAPRAGRDVGVILDGLADPGNAGAILRTAAAFGVGFVASTSGSVDLFSPKVVRSAMGAHFRLALYSHLAWDELLPHLNEAILVAADSREGVELPLFHWPDSAVLVIGSEAEGVSPRAESAIAQRVRIPLRRGVESLNAASAAAILLYSARARDR